MTAQGYIEQLNGEAAGEALSALCALGKTKAGREEINGLLGDRLALHGAAASEKPKVRKNAYRLMGALEDGRDLPVLREALQKEETLFAVPSLLLALGRLGDEETLRAYEPPRPACWPSPAWAWTATTTAPSASTPTAPASPTCWATPASSRRSI